MCSKFLASACWYYMSDWPIVCRVYPWTSREWDATLTGSLWPIKSMESGISSQWPNQRYLTCAVESESPICTILFLGMALQVYVLIRS